MDWSNLRPWEGSQNKAFEELCCQLAHADIPAPAAHFYRKGTPDAGVECFWILPNGDEHAWQAKFLFELGSAQWGEIDESVQTAIDKHPRLVKYTVCLSLDLPDARVTRRSGTRVKSLRDRWDERVAKWQTWAQQSGMAVDFEYWGQFHIARA
jgi:hypothetical protein